MIQIFRFIGACFASVFAAGGGATLVLLLNAVVGAYHDQQFVDVPVILFGMFFLYFVATGGGLLYSLPATLVLGLPTYFALRWIKQDSPWVYAAVGAVAGFLLGFDAPQLTHFSTPDNAIVYRVLTTVAGAAAAAAFGAVMTTDRRAKANA